MRIYEKMGFKMVKEMECDDDGDVCKVRLKRQRTLEKVRARLIGSQLFCMIREPQPIKHDAR